MSLFDYIKCEMPLPSDPAPPDVEWFQTKDAPQDWPCLERWVIRADGRLFKPGVRYEDRSDPSAEGIARLTGMMTPVEDPSLDAVMDDFHGDLVFYHLDWKTREWWEYTARFTEGFCTRVWCSCHEKRTVPPNDDD